METNPINVSEKNGDVCHKFENYNDETKLSSTCDSTGVEDKADLVKPKKEQKLPRSDEVQPRQCQFYVERKKRRCKIWALRHDDYCGEHANYDSKNQLPEFRRVPCPYDPKHTCYERLLDDHMKKCNFRPAAPEFYFSEGLNSGGLVSKKPKGLRELTPEELKRLINIVRTVHKEIVPKVEDRYGIHPELGTEMLRTDIGDEALKHISQNSSLIKLMEDVGLLKDSTCFIEFGSGKGALTYWLAQVTTKASQEVNTSKFILVDKKSHRHKKENKLKDTDVEVERVRIDITNFKLDVMPSIQTSKHSVGVSKHLCGGATDVALKCLLETNLLVSKVSGLAFATCCHHSCDWEHYVGKQSLIEWSFAEHDFKALTGIATWAVCGTGNSRFVDNEDDQNEVINNPVYAELELKTSDRRKLGIMAKEILDFGRICYIKKYSNLEAFVCNFVDLSTTYENRAIVAYSLTE